MSRYTLSLVLVLASGSLLAQGRLVDSREQAQGWYLPISVSVTANGGRTDSLSVALYKDNQLVTELPPAKKRSGFEFDLDIDAHYTVFISKPGYRQKQIQFNTHLPEQQVEYKKYDCFVNLEPMDKFAHADAFYLDFPSSLVNWDDQKKAFDHNDAYLTNIQVRMALLGAQLENQ